LAFFTTNLFLNFSKDYKNAFHKSFGRLLGNRSQQTFTKVVTILPPQQRSQRLMSTQVPAAITAAAVTLRTN
jgi:hypothetical protein